MKKLFTLKSSSITNKILITLLLCVTVGVQSTWAQSHKIFQERSYRANADATNYTVYFTNDQLGGGKVASHTDNFHCVGLGNIETTGNLSFGQAHGNGSTVSLSVSFRKKDSSSSMGGAVVIWFDWDYGNNRDFCVINVPSTCDNEDLVWDLKTITGPTANNMHPWYQGINDNNNFANAINSEWVTKFRVRQNNDTYYNDPAFAAKEAVNGNNAYYIPETAGLLFDTYTRKESFAVACGITVENSEFFQNSASPANYVNNSTYFTPCFGNDNKPRENGSGTTKLTIPNLKKGWYVKLYWARHADNAGHLFTASNVTDLNGQFINQAFSITGSYISASQGNDYVGATTFIVNNEGDVSFELQNPSGWTNLYKIVVSKNYSTDMKVVEVERINEGPITSTENNVQIISTNSPEGNRYDWALNTETDHVTLIGNETKTKIYSGVSGEVLCHNAVSPEFRIEMEGNVQYTSETVQWERRYASNNNLKASYNLLKLNVTGGYGNIKIIQEMKLDAVSAGIKYVLDKKEQWIAVGHVDPQTYPYTWEFTSYNMNDNHCGYGGLFEWLAFKTGTQAVSGTPTTTNLKFYGQYRCWEAETGAPTPEAGTYTMFTANNVPDESLGTTLEKPLFAQGSQLAYRKDGNLFDADEYKGIGVTVEKIATDKYGFIMGKGHGWLWGVTELLIPDVDPGMAVYIQTESAATKPYFEIEGGGTITTDAAALGEGATLIEKKWEGDTFKDDPINTYVLGAIITPTSGNKAHVRVKGLDPTKRIFRIGVTNIRKEINKFGYATESRDCKIDHMMTGFLTKADAHAYFAKEFTEYNNVTSGLEPIGIVKLVPAVKTEDVSIDRGGHSVKQNYENIPEETGVVLYADNVSSAINVPLFVPAIHVKSTSESGNLLEGPVTSKYIDGKGKDYILTNIYQHRQNLNVNLEGSGTEEKIGFYRAQAGTLGANKAYLKLDNVTSSPAKLVLFSFFDGEEEDIHNGITTGIEDATHQMDNGQWTMDNAEWYNLNGQKLNGMPSSSGLYIVNGKKVLVK